MQRTAVDRLKRYAAHLIACPTASTDLDDLPCAGIKVVEFTTMVAAPAACGILADWGAEVIKVEPPGGELLRYIAAINTGNPDQQHPPFIGDNRGKKSVVIDAKSEEGRQALEMLIANADVLISNFRMPALGKLGLDPEALSQRYPKLVVGVITAYGREGKEKDRPGYDVAAFWARSGMSMNPTPKGMAPRVPGNGVGDRITG